MQLEVGSDAVFIRRWIKADAWFNDFNHFMQTETDLLCGTKIENVATPSTWVW